MVERRRAAILGVLVDDVVMAEAVDRLLAVPTGLSCLVVTPNPEMVVTARRDAPFRAVLNAADLAVPDGVGLLVAARLLGEPLRTTVPGVDLVEALAPRAAALGQRWFLLGGRAGVAALAGERLASRHPGLVIAGTYEGEPSTAGERAALGAIAAAGPLDVLLVAYGAPAQEFWLARNLVRSGARVGIGVGGTFNFIAGTSRRPPAWMQRAGLGWLFRLVTEPWRWRRQLALPQFALWAIMAAARRRLAGGGGR